MAKNKRLYGCTDCGATFSKWSGQCGECQAWNTLVETVIDTTPVGGSGSGSSSRSGNWAGEMAQVKTLAEVSTEETPRQPSGSSELDRVLGGGLVSGSVVLIGGDPGALVKSENASVASAALAAYVLARTGRHDLSRRTLEAMEAQFGSGGLLCDPGKPVSVFDNLLYLSIKEMLESR